MTIGVASVAVVVAAAVELVVVREKLKQEQQ